MTRGRGAVVAVVVAVVAGGGVLAGRGACGGGDGGTASGKADAGASGPRGGARATLVPPDPHQAARGSLSGSVRDDQGAPVAGARVCAFASSEELSADEIAAPRCVPSSADGRWQLGDLLAASYQVVVSAHGFVPERWRDPKSEATTFALAAGEHKDGLDVVLARGGVEVRGVVRDLGGGVVAGAWVQVTSGRRSVRRTAVTQSEADGGFVAWVPAGPLRVEAEADGYAPGVTRGTAPGQTLEVLLTPESVLIGRVVEAGSGAPVAGARVSPSPDALSGWDWSGTGAITDAEGMFRLGRLEPGRYKPSARALGHLGVAAESVLLGLGQTSDEIVIEVHAAQVVSGLLVAGGKPCERGYVELDDRDKLRRAMAHADAGGRVTLRAVLPGRYQVSANCSGFPARGDFAHVVVADRDVTGLRWELPAGFTVKGVVVDAEGQGVADAMVEGEIAQKDPRAPRQGTGGRSDRDGRFVLRGVPAGELALEAYSPDHPSPPEASKVTVAGDVDGVRLQMQASGDIAGVVRDETGAPVPGIDVSAAGATRELRGGSTFTGENGEFILGALRPGQYRVRASSRAGERLRTPGTRGDEPQGKLVTVRVGQEARVELVVEARSGVITGRVVDAEGRPVTDAYVDAEREADDGGGSPGGARRAVRYSWRRSPALTDTDGSFRLEKLSPGKHTVRAYRRGGGDAIAEGVAVGTSVTLTILPAGSIRGVVVLTGGGAPEEFEVDVRDRSTGFRSDEQFFRTGGRFFMQELPAGKHQVAVTAAEGTAVITVELAEGEARDGVKIELAARAVIRGTVVAHDTGEPIAGMRVMARPLKGGGSVSFGGNDGVRKNVTDAGGRYELENSPPGRVWVQAVPEDWQQSPYDIGRLLFEVKPGVMNEIPPIRVIRRRLPASEEGGDLGFALKPPAPDADPAAHRLVVEKIRAGGPAAGSGLAVGDEIVTVEGVDVTAPNTHWYRSLANVRVGQAVKLGVRRDGATAPISISIVAGPPPGP